MELMFFLGKLTLGLVKVAAGGYQKYRLWKITRHAPSAKATGFQVSLTKCDYDHLPKKEKDVVYLIVDRPALE